MSLVTQGDGRKDVVINEWHTFTGVTSGKGTSEWYDCKDVDYVNVNIINPSNAVAGIDISNAADKPGDGIATAELNQVKTRAASGGTTFTLGGGNADIPLPRWFRVRVTTNAAANTATKAYIHLRRLG